MERDEQEWGPPLLRLLGGSVIAHVLMLAAILYVPALRDAFMVANALTGFGFVSEDYEKTRVEYERATVINLAAQQLYYPAGYLQDQTALPSPNDPQFVAAYNPPPVRRAATPRPTPSPSPSPDASPSPGDAAQNAEGEKAGASPAPSAEPQSVEEAERLAKESGVEKVPMINKKPFEDLLKRGKEMKDGGQINLEGVLEVTVEADRQADGKLTNIEFDREKKLADPKLSGLKELAAEFVSALSDSKILAMLDGAEHLVLKLKLDNEQVDVRIVSNMSTVDLASSKARGYGLLILGGAIEARMKKKDEVQLFNSTKVASEGKQIILTFNMPRKDVGDLLSKFLKKSETPAPTPAT